MDKNNSTHVIDFEDDPRLHDPRGQHIDWEDIYVDREDNYHIATHVADGDFNRKSSVSGGGGGAPTGCLKPLLIGFGVLAVIGVSFMLICGILMPVIIGLMELFN